MGGTVSVTVFISDVFFFFFFFFLGGGGGGNSVHE